MREMAVPTTESRTNPKLIKSGDYKNKCNEPLLKTVNKFVTGADAPFKISSHAFASALALVTAFHSLFALSLLSNAF